MSTTFPVLVLTVLGVLVAVLGFLAGSIEMTALGLGAVAVAGLLAVLGGRRS